MKKPDTTARDALEKAFNNNQMPSKALIDQASKEELREIRNKKQQVEARFPQIITKQLHAFAAMWALNVIIGGDDIKVKYSQNSTPSKKGINHDRH